MKKLTKAQKKELQEAKDTYSKYKTRTIVTGLLGLLFFPIWLLTILSAIEMSAAKEKIDKLEN